MLENSNEKVVFDEIYRFEPITVKKLSIVTVREFNDTIREKIEILTEEQ
jgi:hypothetical protein